MLVVLERAPGTTPAEAVLEEKAVAEVAALYLVVEAALAMGIGFGVGWLDEQPAIGTPLDIGIVQRIDVNSHPHGMGRDLATASHGAVAEAGGVVGPHGAGRRVSG